MTTALLTPNPKFQGFASNGDPLSGGKLYSYATGTSTPLATYPTKADAEALTNANANPVVLDSRGEANVWLVGTQLYRFTLTTSADAAVWGPIEGIGNTLASSLSGQNGASLIGFIQSGAGAVARTVESKERDLLHIADFGGSAGASAATNTTALTAAITQAAALGKAGVEIGPGGTWALTAGTNWASRDIAIIGNGKPILDFSAGAGIGFKLDSGGSGAYVRGMRVENFIIKGGAAITDIFYSRGMVGGQFRNIEVREGTTTGFKLLFSVLDTYEDCRVSNDSLAMATSPTSYFSLDDDGTAGNRCQANTFTNCDASGAGAGSTSTGFVLINATLNTFKGGTAESLLHGIDIRNAACRLNSFADMDLEHNVNDDIMDAGTSTTFNNVSSTGGGASSAIQLTGHGVSYIGGAIALLNTGTSTDSSFLAAFADGVAILGTGTYRRIGCYTIDNAGLYVASIPDEFDKIVSKVGATGTPNIKAITNTTAITGSDTPLFSVAFSGFWCVRDNTSAGVAFGTCDSGLPNCTTISNTITATVVFSLSGGGIVQAKTTAGTATRTMASFGVALQGG